MFSRVRVVCTCICKDCYKCHWLAFLSCQYMYFLLCSLTTCDLLNKMMIDDYADEVCQSVIAKYSEHASVKTFLSAPVLLLQYSRSSSILLLL